MKNNNKNILESINGDVFAKKIECDDKNFNGKYLLFIRYTNESYENEIDKINGKKMYLFRIKLASKNLFSNIAINIDKAEFIIARHIMHYFRFLPLKYGQLYREAAFEKADYDFKTDDIGCLYSYLTRIVFNPNFINDYLYVGNFNVIPPQNEYIPDSPYFGTGLVLVDNSIPTFLNNYKKYNVKDSEFYKIESVKEKNKKAYANFLELIDNECTIYKYAKRNLILQNYGPKIYESKLAEQFEKKFKKFNSIAESSEKIMKMMKTEFLDCFYNENITPLAWLIMADLGMKYNKLDEETRQMALKSISYELFFWKDEINYFDRQNELNNLKVKLENYSIKEIEELSHE